MSNNKKQTVVQLIIQSLDIECKSRGMNVNWDMYLQTEKEEIEQAKAMHKEELNVAYGNGYEQGEMDFYKKMQVKGDKYAEGYSEGYKRALELVKWKIDNDLQGGNNEQQ